MKQDLIRAFHMLPDEGIVLCAVSGGADSMCLLAWLGELAPKYGFRVAAAHFHHGLRGSAADRDEQFVRDYCAQHEIPFYAEHGDVAAAAREHGWSVEEAGRNLRYAFLSATAKKISAMRVATAHNRGDNAETVLMNLIRGTGLTGLSGIAPVRGIFIRPLLETGRDEIEEYLQRNHIPHVEDETNAEDCYARNQIRHTLMPLLRQWNPRVEETIAKTAGLLREEDAYLSRVTERVCGAVRQSPGCAVIDRSALTELPRALRGRVIRAMLDSLGTAKKDISARHIEAILHLIEHSGPTAQLSLPRGLLAENRYEEFCLLWKSGGALRRSALPPVGEVVCGGWRIECRVVREPVAPREGRLILNNDAITAPVTVDRWREGSRMTLPGQAGSRSLKRLFVDAGVSVSRREETPVLYVGACTAAVPGIGVDRRFAGNTGNPWNYVVDFFKIQKF